MNNRGTTISPHSTQDEYDALLREILESDSSGDDHPRQPLIPSRTHTTPSSPLDLDLYLDLDLDFDIPPSQHTRTRQDPVHKTVVDSNDSTPRNSTDTQQQKRISTVSIVIENDQQTNQKHPQLNSFEKEPSPRLLPGRQHASSLLSLSSPSSVSSSPSSSINTLTRASSVESSSARNGQSHPRNTIQFLDTTSSILSTFPVSSSLDVETALEDPHLDSNYISNLKSFKQRERNSVAHSVAKSLEDHQRTLVHRHEQRLARYNQRHDSLLKQTPGMDTSNHRVKPRENGTQRSGRDAAS